MALIRRTKPSAKLVRRSSRPPVGRGSRVTHPRFPEFGPGLIDATAEFRGKRWAFIHCDNLKRYSAPVEELRRA